MALASRDSLFVNSAKSIDLKRSSLDGAGRRAGGRAVREMPDSTGRS
jgi:hypothetical protein